MGNTWKKDFWGFTLTTCFKSSVSEIIFEEHSGLWKSNEKLWTLPRCMSLWRAHSDIFWGSTDFLGASQVALVVKNPPANAAGVREVSSIPGSGRTPGEGNGNTLQYSCLENPMDRGIWWAIVDRVAKSQTWLSDWNDRLLGAHMINHSFDTAF